MKYADVERVQYYEDQILTKNVDAIEKRNSKKADVLYKLSVTGKVNNISYRLYFNSCNLEHVLYGQLKEFSSEEKEELADDFAEKYEGKLDDFIQFISDEAVATAGTYRQTWKYIGKENHSLQRNSNMHLIFK